MPARDVPILPPDNFNALAICRHGPMLYNRNDQYVGASIRKYGEFSPGESWIFRTVLAPGAVVVEVGANIGAHTVELSRLVAPGGVVHAFEPQRIVFQTMCANLALNGCVNVFAHQAAVGAVAGEILVPFLPPRRPNNFGGLSLQGATQGESGGVHGSQELHELVTDQVGGFVLHPMAHIVEFEPALSIPPLKAIAKSRRAEARMVIFLRHSGVPKHWPG